jgi:hypothetical protein
LERDNTKRYFDAHRRTYQSLLFEPSKAFVDALGAALQQRVAEGLRAEPRIGGSLFWIANDLRFAKDKPPYKPHLDFAFWEGRAGPRRDPALILRIAPAGIHLGAAVFALTGAALERYRTALSDMARAFELDTAVAPLVDTGAELSEPTRVRHQPASPQPTLPPDSPYATAFTSPNDCRTQRPSPPRNSSFGAPTGSHPTRPFTGGLPPTPAVPPKPGRHAHARGRRGVCSVRCQLRRW